MPTAPCCGLLPLRDAFVALFFVTVGTLINPRGVFADIGVLLAIVGDGGGWQSRDLDRHHAGLRLSHPDVGLVSELG